MPITVSWHDASKTIVHLSYLKPWNWPEFETAIVEANALMDTVDHPVDMIVQMHDGLPREISPARFRTIFQHFHRNIRSTALLGANDLIRVTITAFMRVLGQDHREFFFAASIDDALKRFDKNKVEIEAEKVPEPPATVSSGPAMTVPAKKSVTSRRSRTRR
jgi:hypothetical protein